MFLMLVQKNFEDNYAARSYAALYIYYMQDGILFGASFLCVVQTPYFQHVLMIRCDGIIKRIISCCCGGYVAWMVFGLIDVF